MAQSILVQTTVPSEEDAKRLARRLVSHGSAGCVQIVGPILSVYRWKDDVEEATEWLCLIKSVEERYGDLERLILTDHPYDLPEIVSLDIEAGSAAYLAWLLESTLGHDT